MRCGVRLAEARNRFPEPRLAMPQRPPVARRVLPALLVLAAAPLGAQAGGAHSATNALSDSEWSRAPHFFASAATVPAGMVAFSLQGDASRQTFTTFGLEQTTTVRSKALSAEASAVFGLTSTVTLAPYIGASSVEMDLSESPTLAAPLATIRRQEGAPTSDLPPAPRTRRRGLEIDELGLATRASLFRSASGATRVGVNATVFDRVDFAPSLLAGVAVQQSFGRVTMHVSPSLRLTRNSDSRTLGFNGATVLAATGRLGLSLEGAHYRSWWSKSDLDPMVTSYAGGALRYRLGRLAIEGAVRTLLEHGAGNIDVDEHTVHLGTHWTF